MYMLGSMTQVHIIIILNKTQTLSDFTGILDRFLGQTLP
jgi:hypothetical protein